MFVNGSYLGSKVVHSSVLDKKSKRESASQSCLFKTKSCQRNIIRNSISLDNTRKGNDEKRYALKNFINLYFQTNEPCNYFSMWILLVEDEKQLASSLKRGLEEEDHVVEVSYDGEEAELQGFVNDYDMVVLDWRLPNRDGKEILEAWRAKNRTFPVLMLTALGDLDHKVIGLDAGADDYMSKPFSFEELLARIRALARRSPDFADTETVNVGPIKLNTRKHKVYICSSEIALRPKEFILLQLLLNEPESVFSKTNLAERVWGSAYHVSDNTIEATISTLRQKLTGAFEQCEAFNWDKDIQLIETVRGAGYRFNYNLFSDQG